MTYVQAREISLLRFELRAACNRGDRNAALEALARLSQMAGNDNELGAEIRRWTIKLDACGAI